MMKFGLQQSGYSERNSHGPKGYDNLLRAAVLGKGLTSPFSPHQFITLAFLIFFVQNPLREFVQKALNHFGLQWNCTQSLRTTQQTPRSWVDHVHGGLSFPPYTLLLIQSAHFGDHVRISLRMNPEVFDYNKGLMPIMRTTVITYPLSLHFAPD
jgi:hypothetical protein